MLRRRRFDRFPVSVHIFFVRGESVLMMRRRGTGFCDGMRSVPAGHVMEAETILQAAAREAREEVGLEVSPSALTVVGVMHRRSTEARIDFFIKAETWDGEPRNMEPDKCDEVTWFPKSRLPGDTIPYVRRALLNAERSPWFEEFIDMPAQQNEGAYAAFISHSGSLEIAERLSYNISRVGLSPWQFAKWAGLKVFFDRKQLRTGDLLPHTISDAIKNSQYFVLFASRAAARSKWVSKELELWLQDRPATDVLLIVLDGTIEWDHERNDFDWEVTDCIPPIPTGRNEEEVCWADMKNGTTLARARGDKKKLREAAASVGAKVKGVTKDDILRRWRRMQIQLLLFVGVLLLGFLGAIAVAGYYRYVMETPADKAYNEGRQTLDKRTNWHDIMLAMKSFERALALNPQHVPALLALADAHTLLLGYGAPVNPREELEQAQEAVNRAKQLGGDTTSEYHRVRGRLLLYKDRDGRGAA